MFNKDDLQGICDNYNIVCDRIGKLIDTSRSSEDKRFNYQINDHFFLKINNFIGKTEKTLLEINQLIMNYKSIGVYCPTILSTKDGSLSVHFKKDEILYTCHLEEKADYAVGKDDEGIDYTLKKEVLEHLGQLATKYSNHNLTANKSMWSVVELSSYDTDVDEKQENFNSLIACLNDLQHYALSNKLISMNFSARSKIKDHISILPKCVYQGDLNSSNILLDDNNKFCGLIDFNMYGTEVNINCFLNESMYYLTKDDFDELSAQDIYNKMTNIQEEMLSVIFESYSLNNDEQSLLYDYKKVIFSSFYPNIVLMIGLLKRDFYIDKVIRFLELLYEF